VSSDSLAHACAVVTDMYQRIGLRTEWTGVVQQNEKHPGSAPRGGSISRLPIAQVTLIILTPKMAARGRVEEGALGFAAVPEGTDRLCDLRPRQRDRGASGDEPRRPARIRDSA
jgi:hypothetical protein